MVLEDGHKPPPAGNLTIEIQKPLNLSRKMILMNVHSGIFVLPLRLASDTYLLRF